MLLLAKANAPRQEQTPSVLKKRGLVLNSPRRLLKGRIQDRDIVQIRAHYDIFTNCCGGCTHTFMERKWLTLGAQQCCLRFIGRELGNVKHRPQPKICVDPEEL